MPFSRDNGDMTGPLLEVRRSRWPLRIAYATGDAGFNLVWVLFDSFLIYFYAEVFALPAWALTPVLLAGRGADFVCSLLMGTWADRTRSRFGSYRPFLLWAAAPLALATVFLFSAPAAWPVLLQRHVGTSQGVRWAFATAMIFGAFYATANVAYTALLSAITNDPKERVGLSAARFAAAAGSVLLVQSFTLPLVGHFGLGHAALGWQRVSLLYAVIGSLLLIGCFAGTREIVQPLPVTINKPARPLLAVIHSRSFIRLLLATLLSLAALTCRGTITPFYVSYNAGHSTWIGFTLASNSIAALAACIVLPYLRQNWLPPRRIAILGAMAGSLLCLPPAVWGNPRLPKLILLQILFGVSTGTLLPALFSLFAELPGRLDAAGGYRTAGLIASGSLISLKLGGALGAVLVSSSLGHLGFQAAPTQPGHVLDGIKFLFTIVPAGIFMLTFLTLKIGTREASFIKDNSKEQL
ncbi:MFS transporter [Tunturiibacter empetritectus]|uniref:GPH family glycoside/pentoside/hexuronide:cation symporter n=1 Tax=Tunturiibacter lichenicola TaxID=2051959 RepID=A0A852V4L1_9BACT|nr:MFS transporter [Edaphobacter lichenicola]NYF87988.1 GPH family glycoside/pentoside/hexuronide:cation symporter [Edaphobacter lichenicola]